MTYQQQAYYPSTSGKEHFSNASEITERGFYKEVMLWLLACFAIATIGTFLIGPMIPLSLMMPLYMVLLVSMIAASFLKKSYKGSGLLAILYSLGLGIILYPTLNYYVSSGSGNIVVVSLGGTAVVFGTAAILGWKSSKSLESISGKLFAILLGVIATSLLNTFFFHLEWVQLLIAWGALVIFSLYSFIDVQRIKSRTGNAPASWYALNVFLDVYNIFVSLLQILGGSSRR